MDDVVKEFIVESNENLDRLERDLVALEEDPASQELLAGIFRAIHTIKGATGFLGYSKLESVVHAGESLLSRLRDGALRLNPEITSGLLAMVDAVRQMLVSIEATGTDGDRDYRVLVRALTRLQPPSDPGASPSTPALKSPNATAPAIPPARNGTPAESRAAAKSQVPALQATPAEGAVEGASIGEILINSGRVTREQVAAALNQQMEGDPRHLGEILVDQKIIRPGDVLEVLEIQKEMKASALSSNNIRVDVGQLDKLMHLVGELVLVRSQVLQFRAAQQDASFLSTTERLNLITTELQDSVMKMRRQPIDTVWSKFPRVVRDLATSCGKHVRVEMEGKETKLDKTILEAIKDPLTHIVRNAVDHGIETPSERAAAGKPAEGRLLLRAYYAGGQVNIEILDDGAGIDVARVKRKAVERGIITPEQAALMGEQEAVNLVFLPGVSTAGKVTNVSGRGVGMDVVRTNIEKIGGTVEIQNKPGEGTALKIKIPLALAIIPALIVTTAGDR